MMAWAPATTFAARSGRRDGHFAKLAALAKMIGSWSQPRCCLLKVSKS